MEPCLATRVNVSLTKYWLLQSVYRPVTRREGARGCLLLACRAWSAYPQGHGLVCLSSPSAPGLLPLMVAWSGWWMGRWVDEWLEQPPPKWSICWRRGILPWEIEITSRVEVQASFTGPHGRPLGRAACSLSLSWELIQPGLTALALSLHMQTTQATPCHRDSIPMSMDHWMPQPCSLPGLTCPWHAKEKRSSKHSKFGWRIVSP